MSHDNLSPEGSAMDSNNSAPNPKFLSQTSLGQKLRSCNGDRSKLEKQVGQLLKEDFTESLRVLEEIFKHKPGDPVEKQQLFQAYKSRILNTGNRLLRELPNVLSCFFVEQLLVREVVTRQLPKEPGPWGLPQGIKHPSEKQG
jgi:hypothetical protein